VLLVAEALAGQAGMHYIDLKGFDIPESFRDLVPSENIRAYEHRAHRVQPHQQAAQGGAQEP
jgi:hypothetical protein